MYKLVRIANIAVKEAILESFRDSEIVAYPGGFVDKESLPARQFSVEDKVRIVPGGSAVRYGAYVAEGVIIMPPAYVNIPLGGCIRRIC